MTNTSPSKTARRTADAKLQGARFRVGRPGEYWVELPIGPDWIASQRLSLRDGVLVVAELRVFPAEKPRGRAGEWSRAASSVPPGGLSSVLLRRVPVGGRIVAPAVSDWLEWAIGEGANLTDGRSRRLAQRIAADFQHAARPARVPTGGSGRRGRPSRDEAFYRRVARAYRRWLHDNPARHIAAQWGVPHATARNWIRVARHRYNLLPPTTQGRLSPASRV